jgi:glucose/arabinose dehydrogenase
MSGRRRRRRRFLSLLSLSLLPGGYAFAASPPNIIPGGISLGLDPVTSVGGPPLALDYAPDGSDRLFIAGQTNGQVRLVKNGALVGTPFLNLSTAGVSLYTGGESGIIGIAFHPNFNGAGGTPGAGKFYTFLSEPKTGTPDFSHPELTVANGNTGDHDNVLLEWTIQPGADTVDYSVAPREILRIRKPQENHNGGALRFGYDAGHSYLYMAIGDGGGGNDQYSNGSVMPPITSANDGHSSGGNAQDTSVIYGKILRIDPVAPAANPGSTDPVSVNSKYRVPAANPFSGATPGLDEIYAYGLRNPFRFSFDRGGTHQLYAGDVGQAQREEVDIVQSGLNYGWVNMEGTLVNTTAIASEPPIAEYTHANGGIAIIGGSVYRGSNFPELSGKYIFGDLGASGSGRLYYIDNDGTTGQTIHEFTYALNAPAAQLYSFGEDKDGELYAMFSNGTVARLLGRQWMTNGGGSWNTSTNWLAGLPNAVGADANFLGRVTTPATASVTLDGSKTVGNLRFNNPTHSYTIAPGTGGTLTLNSATTGLVQTIRGAHLLSVPVSIAANTNVDIAAGSGLTISVALGVSSGRTLTKIGAGALTLSGPITFTTGSGSTLALSAGDVVLSPGTATAILDNVTTSGGRLDLTGNKLLIRGTPIGTLAGSTYTGVTGLVQSGRNGEALPHWDGVGIVTSQTAATGGNYTSIGVARGSEVNPQTVSTTATWGGQTITGTDTLVMYTYGGDATLDGKINIDDYVRIDQGISAGLTGWFNGDFNFDGKVSIDDYLTVIDANIGTQGAPFPTAGGIDQTVAVPEPTCVLGLPAIFGLMRRQRRTARVIALTALPRPGRRTPPDSRNSASLAHGGRYW